MTNIAWPLEVKGGKMTENNVTQHNWSSAIRQQANIQIGDDLENSLVEAIDQECGTWMEHNFDTVTVDRLGPDIMNDITIPDWVPNEDGYIATSAIRIGKDNRTNAVIVSYTPNRTLGVGFSKVFIVESKTKQPFPRMNELWKELSKRSKDNKKNNSQSNGLYISIPQSFSGYSLPSNITISTSGELRSAFGCPKPIEVYGISVALNTIYREWKPFPNETDYEIVKKLKDAKDKVAAMQSGAQDCEREINNARNSIKEYQKHITDVETRMNKLYEDAADAMNLLEAHGIKVDLNEEKKTSNGWYMDDDEISMFSDFVSMPYSEGQFITINKSYGNSIYSTSC